MTRQTRFFVLGAGGVLVLGLCTGLFAYVNRGAALAVSATGPVELRYVPANASVVGYANIQEVMRSDVRERIRDLVPDGVRENELESQLGLDVERDIDHMVTFLAPSAEERPAGLALFRGRFDTARLEGAARGRGATVHTYEGKRVVSVETEDAGSLAMVFMEPGLIAVGDLPTVQQAISRGVQTADVTSNPGMMSLLALVEEDCNAWAVGRFGDLSALGFLPDDVSAQMPAVSAFAVSGRITDGVSGSLSIEGRDEEAGQNLRDVLRGFLALATMQTNGRPELQTMLESLQLSGVGAYATLSFWIPSDALDLFLSSSDES
ncbi:MAG: hypothetical protein P8J30_01825 [Ilumatobacter sp.]|nr:hypothetical protein [Ilumatobacter sp.]